MKNSILLFHGVIIIIKMFIFVQSHISFELSIFRYKYCWLPLLAKYTEPAFSEAPLVVPLDCEWIWHCHRLNPVWASHITKTLRAAFLFSATYIFFLLCARLGNGNKSWFLPLVSFQLCYKIDCEKLYGRILDNVNVVSSVEGTCSKHTEEIWNNIYPNEPYEFETSSFNKTSEAENILGHSKSTDYDLVSAVKRQTPFFYQVILIHFTTLNHTAGDIAWYT